LIHGEPNVTAALLLASKARREPSLQGLGLYERAVAQFHRRRFPILYRAPERGSADPKSARGFLDAISELL
jgi:hypothetical protein